MGMLQGQGQDVAGAGNGVLRDMGMLHDMGCCRTWGVAGHGMLQGQGQDVAATGHGGVADQLAVVGYHFHGENCSLVA